MANSKAWLQLGGRRAGKTAVAVEATKHWQRQGRRVYWGTVDMPATVEMLSRHGALCEIVDDNFVAPHFPRLP